MYVSFEAGRDWLLYYAEQHGLPFIATDSESRPLAFIFETMTGCDVRGLVQIESIEGMLEVANAV